PSLPALRVQWALLFECACSSAALQLLRAVAACAPAPPMQHECRLTCFERLLRHRRRSRPPLGGTSNAASALLQAIPRSRPPCACRGLWRPPLRLPSCRLPCPGPCPRRDHPLTCVGQQSLALVHGP